MPPVGRSKRRNVFGIYWTTPALRENGPMQCTWTLSFQLPIQTAPEAASSRRCSQPPRRCLAYTTPPLRKTKVIWSTYGKITRWNNRMCNGHLPAHMPWVVYKLQLWPSLCYGLGTMTNDLKDIETIFNKADYEILPILGVARTVNRELRKLHTTFGGFGLFNLPMKQLICRINILLQHYHTLTVLSRKLDASFWYLQLQLGTPYNPLTLPFEKWGHLAPLSWVKILWSSLLTNSTSSFTWNIPRFHSHVRGIMLS